MMQMFFQGTTPTLLRFIKFFSFVVGVFFSSALFIRFIGHSPYHGKMRL
jgi:hypothetical protein